MARKIREENYDYVTVISGYEGSGKSTLALQVAGYTDPTFKGERVAFDGDELLELMESAPRGASILFDEAAKGLYNRESMTATNRAITTAAMIARAKNYHLVLCIPSFWSLDGYFRDHRARCWIHVDHRGESIVHVPVRNRYSKDVFWEQVLLQRFNPLSGPTWDEYERRKMAFIDRALREAKTGKKDGEDEEEDAATHDNGLAEEIAANDEFWTAGGNVKRALIAARFNLSNFKARHVGEVAKVLRGERG